MSTFDYSGADLLPGSCYLSPNVTGIRLTDKYSCSMGYYCPNIIVGNASTLPVALLISHMIILANVSAHSRLSNHPTSQQTMHGNLF